MRGKTTNLLSRKFLLTLIPAVMGVVAMFITDDFTVRIIGLSLTTLVGIVYNIIEGKLDKASIEASVDKVLEILVTLGVLPDPVDDEPIEPTEDVDNGE